MPSRRSFIGLPLAAFALSPVSLLRAAEQQEKRPAGFASPPVVQNPGPDGCTFTFRVTGLASAELQWGASADKLDQVVKAAHHGLIQADDRVLSLRLRSDRLPADGVIHYRIVLHPLRYLNAYKLERGEPVFSPVRRLKLPRAAADTFSFCAVSDTHEAKSVIAGLARRIEALDPDVLVWNGDTCRDFDAGDEPAAILLDNGAGATPELGGWASTRPLLFVPGNHDVRGQLAQEVPLSMRPWPGDPELPYNFAIRCGPVALIGLETGEDKPDAHPVFAGMAAYEEHRRRQAQWLNEAVKRPEIAAAPYKVALCHIPLRGVDGDDNDGRTLQGYAHHSGEGLQLWGPTLRASGFRLVVSGHTHQWRIQDPEASEPLMQAVGGGPQSDNAVIIHLQADAARLVLRIEDFAGKELARRELPPA
ncbi:MAG: hypothetical protein RL095_2429 [Verrucomicrobiota bacterium]|jgi:predicted phosphodiesterase